MKECLVTEANCIWHTKSTIILIWFFISRLFRIQKISKDLQRIILLSTFQLNGFKSKAFKNFVRLFLYSKVTQVILMYYEIRSAFVARGRGWGRRRGRRNTLACINFRENIKVLSVHLRLQSFEYSSYNIHSVRK